MTDTRECSFINGIKPATAYLNPSTLDATLRECCGLLKELEMGFAERGGYGAVGGFSLGNRV